MTILYYVRIMIMSFFIFFYFLFKAFGQNKKKCILAGNIYICLYQRDLSLKASFIWLV